MRATVQKKRAKYESFLSSFLCIYFDALVVLLS